MATIREALGAAAKASFCTLTAPVDKTVTLAEDWIDNQNIPGIPQGPTPFASGLRAARNLLCNEAPDDVSPGLQPPFSGGQCPGTIYDTSVQAFLNGNPFGAVQNNSGPGPITLRRGYNPDTNFVSVDLVDANGASLGGIGSGAQNEVDLQVLSVTPQSGQPNNCGDPGPDIIPYVPDNFTDSPTVTYTPDSGPDISLTVPLVFAPVKVDVDRRIVVPFTLEFSPDITLNAELDLSDDTVNFNLDINNELPTAVDDPTVITDPDGEPGDDPTEEEELERAIIGVYVRTTQIDEVFPGSPSPTDNPGSEFFVPRLGSVSFHVEQLSSPGLGWTEDLDVKYTSQVIPCPVAWGAKSVVATPQPGVTFEVTVIRGESPRSLALRAAGVV